MRAGSRNYFNGLCLQRDRISLVKGEKDVLCRIAMPLQICEQSQMTSTLFCIVLRVPGWLLILPTYCEDRSVCLDPINNAKRTSIAHLHQNAPRPAGVPHQCSFRFKYCCLSANIFANLVKYEVDVNVDFPLHFGPATDPERPETRMHTSSPVPSYFGERETVCRMTSCREHAIGVDDPLSVLPTAIFTSLSVPADRIIWLDVPCAEEDVMNLGKADPV
jgi:hypothetical protein